MFGNKQGSPLDHHPSNLFRGVRFVLSGFDPLNKANVLKKLVDGGAVDAGQFGPNCTHVIVHRLVYDDPLCIAARSNGKILVTSLWVDHSFDAGMPVDLSSIMYRPLRDLNGIPGAKFLVICLTGYQHQDREDIMTMVGLMGATFSKPLVAHKVTHLVCFKFEGEKYELAKKMKRIKLVNHLWLEDCLRAWQIITEANYDKSGYELTMEAEAKDSEEEREGEGVDSKQHAGRAASIQHPFMLKEETSREPPDCFAPKGFGNIKGMSALMEKNTSAQVPNLVEMQRRHSGMFGPRDASGPSSPYNVTATHATGQNELTSTSKDVRTPNSNASKLEISYSKKTPRRTTPPTLSGEDEGNLNSSIKRGILNLGKAVEFSSSAIPNENVKTDSVSFKTTDKGSALRSEEKQSGTLSEKRKTEVLSGSSKLQKTGSNTKAHIPDRLVMASRTGRAGLDFWESEPVDTSTHASPCKSIEVDALDLVKKSSSISSKPSSSIWKSVKRSSPISNTVASEIMQEENTEAVQTYLKRLERATLNSKDCGDVGMSTPQPAIVEDQKRQNEAREIMIKTPCTEKSDIKKSDTSMKSVSVGVSRRQHLADEDHDLHNEMQHILIPSSNTKRSDIQKSPNSGNLVPQTGGVLESDSKPLGRKMVGKKLLGPNRSLGKGKTTNQKGSIFLKKTNPMNASLTCSALGEELEHLQKVEKAGAAAISETEMVMEKTNGRSERLAESNSVCVDDETEPPVEAPAGEKYDKVEGENIAGKIADDQEQLEGGTGQTSAARGKKSQLKESFHTGNEVMEKVTKRKKRSLSKSKRTSVPSVSRVSTEKMIPVDGQTESPEPKEKAINDEYEEAELGNTNSVAKDEGKNCKMGESINTKNPVLEKITKGKKFSLSKSKSKAAPSVLCGTTKQGASKDKSASEDKIEKKERDKDTVPRSVGRTKKALAKNVSKNSREVEKENQPIHIGDENKGQSKKQKGKMACKVSNKSYPIAGESVLDLSRKECIPQTEPVWFILSGNRLQRREFRKVLKRLKGRVCRDSHQWSYQATHFIVPDPIRRTEKFFAAAASGRWILRTEFLTASNLAGKFLLEEPYEWHKNGLSDDNATNLEAPRMWRLLKEKTGHGAFYGMRIIIYGECISPPLDTLKRVVMAGDGTILATSPPYTRFLGSGVDFAIVSPSMPEVDIWVQEFLRHEIPCVLADYLVEYVCKPGHPLDSHVQYSTHAWAEKSFNNLQKRLQEIIEPSTPPCDDDDDVACEVCGSRDRGDVMLICGDESGCTGCGVGTHIDCCDPPLEDVPEEDWYCPKCSTSSSKTPQNKTKKKASTRKRK